MPSDKWRRLTAATQPKAIDFLCAGSHLARCSYAQDVDEAMKQVKYYSAELGVAFVSIDAVPHQLRRL
jgi:hypothetical protein